MTAQGPASPRRGVCAAGGDGRPRKVSRNALCVAVAVAMVTVLCGSTARTFRCAARRTLPICCTPTSPRDRATLKYTKDLGPNMLRLEGKFPGERPVQTADELGIPLMLG